MSSPPTHPLAATVARLARRSPWMACRIEGDGQDKPAMPGAFGGFRYGSVLEPGGLEPVLAHAAARLDHQPRVVAMASVLALGWASRIWLGALLVDRRVPLATLADATTDLGADEVDGSVVLPHARFACLPADRAARHPDASPVADLEALEGVFQRVVTDALLVPVMDALVARGAVGHKALAGMVASRFASAAEYLAKGPAERRAMGAQALAIAAGHPATRGALPVLFEERRGGGFALAHVRGACCLFYELPGGQKCGAACPITPEGRARLRSARRTPA